MGAQCSTHAGKDDRRTGCRCSGNTRLAGPENAEEPDIDFSDSLVMHVPVLPSRDRQSDKTLPEAGCTVLFSEHSITSASTDLGSSPRAIFESDHAGSQCDREVSSNLSTRTYSKGSAEAGVSEQTGGNVIEDDAISLASSCSRCSSPRRRRTVLVGGQLPLLAKHNPDDLTNVYSFSKGVLAKGAFGTVRKATVRATGAKRAINSIPVSQSEEEMANVRGRIDITTSFDHPNILSLHEVFEDESSVHLVMDLCSGGTLEVRLEEGPLTEVRVGIVMQQVVRAVHYMHKNQVCHRDLQPQKILFASSAKEISGTSLIKVSGFATSCNIQKRQKLSEIVGRVGYMAPEMVAGSYGQECDLWSCGCVLFRMLCGRLPFPCEHEPGERRRSQRGDEPLFTAENANVSRSAQELIGCLLKSHPSSRYDVKQTLHHEWFRKSTSKLNAPRLDISTLNNVRAFRKKNAFEQEACRMIASHLSGSETSQSRKLFVFLDKDGDGKLTPSELEKAINMDPKTRAAFPNVSEFFGRNDADAKSVAFSYTEFLAATFDREQCLTEAACQLAFRCFDKNRDGWISMYEFAQSLPLLNTSAEEIDRIFEDIDKNADCKIDFEEFMLMMKGPCQ